MVFQMSFCLNFSRKIESDICVRVRKGRRIYNLIKKVQKYNLNDEKIEVLAVSYQKLQMSGTSKERRSSGWGGAHRNIFWLCFSNLLFGGTFWPKMWTISSFFGWHQKWCQYQPPLVDLVSSPRFDGKKFQTNRLFLAAETLMLKFSTNQVIVGLMLAICPSLRMKSDFTLL